MDPFVVNTTLTVVFDQFKGLRCQKLASDLGGVRFLTVDIYTLKGTDRPNARDV